METNLYPMVKNGMAIMPSNNTSNNLPANLSSDDLYKMLMVKMYEEQNATNARFEHQFNTIQDKIEDIANQNKIKEEEYQLAIFESSIAAGDNQYGSPTEIGRAAQITITAPNVKHLMRYAGIIYKNNPNTVPVAKYFNSPNGSLGQIAIKNWETNPKNNWQGWVYKFNIKKVWKLITTKMQKDGILVTFNKFQTIAERNDFIKRLEY